MLGPLLQSQQSLEELESKYLLLLMGRDVLFLTTQFLKERNTPVIFLPTKSFQFVTVSVLYFCREDMNFLLIREFSICYAHTYSPVGCLLCHIQSIAGPPQFRIHTKVLIVCREFHLMDDPSVWFFWLQPGKTAQISRADIRDFDVFYISAFRPSLK